MGVRHLKVQCVLLFKSLWLVVGLLCISGCASNLLLFEEAEVVGTRGLIAEELTGARLAPSMAYASRFGLTTDEAAALSRAYTGLSTDGSLLASEEIAIRSSLSRIRLIRNPGGNPLLMLKGASEPFAEVLSREGKIKLLYNNELVSIGNDIYVIKGSSIQIRSVPSFSSANVVFSLEEGEIVTKLTQRDGWYQIKCIHDRRELIGWIPEAELWPLFLILAGKNNPQSKNDDDPCSLNTIIINNTSVFSCKIYMSNMFYDNIGDHSLVKIRVGSGTYSIKVIPNNIYTHLKEHIYNITLSCGENNTITYP